jgi:hypothetical protein
MIGAKGNINSSGQQTNTSHVIPATHNLTCWTSQRFAYQAERPVSVCRALSKDGNKTFSASYVVSLANLFAELFLDMLPHLEAHLHGAYNNERPAACSGDQS